MNISSKLQRHPVRYAAVAGALALGAAMSLSPDASASSHVHNPRVAEYQMQQQSANIHNARVAEYMMQHHLVGTGQHR